MVVNLERLKQIDWERVKNHHPHSWHAELTKATSDLLRDSDRVELSRYNELGYYHRVREAVHFRKMKKEWRATKEVPPNWISKGNNYGLWTAMMSPHNTFSVTSRLCV